MSNQGYIGQQRPESTTSDYGVQEFIISQIINRLATATLAVVKEATATRVAVQPLVAQIDGQGNTTAHGTIYDLPFFRLQAGASAVIIDPQVGDIGLCLFCHNDISAVKATKAPGPPGSFRRYDWADGIYLGGLLNGAATQFLHLAADGAYLTSTAKVTLTAPEIDIVGHLKVTGDLDVLSLIHI